MIIPPMRTVCFNAAAAVVQQRVVSTTQQHENRQRGFATVGPVIDVMAVDVASVRATRKTAGAVAQ